MGKWGKWRKSSEGNLWWTTGMETERCADTMHGMAINDKQKRKCWFKKESVQTNYTRNLCEFKPARKDIQIGLDSLFESRISGHIERYARFFLCLSEWFIGIIGMKNTTSSDSSETGSSFRRLLKNTSEKRLIFAMSKWNNPIRHRSLTCWYKPSPRK